MQKPFCIDICTKTTAWINVWNSGAWLYRRDNAFPMKYFEPFCCACVSGATMLVLKLFFVNYQFRQHMKFSNTHAAWIHGKISKTHAAWSYQIHTLHQVIKYALFMDLSNNCCLKLSENSHSGNQHGYHHLATTFHHWRYLKPHSTRSTILS